MHRRLQVGVILVHCPTPAKDILGINPIPDSGNCLIYRETLTALGPSFIKAGQVLASRPDIVRADYMEELCTLQDDVPSFPDEQVLLLLMDWHPIYLLCQIAM
jgi:hypothetical protein